jgi:hypothetical protein
MQTDKHNPFKLKDFMGVDSERIAKLKAIRVTNTDQMLSAGRTAERRAELAKNAGIPLEAVVELVKLSDLACLPGVKGIRTRLYYDAGVDTVEKLAAWEPEVLLAMTTEFVNATVFPGIAPLPKEVRSTVATAHKMSKILEW